MRSFVKAIAIAGVVSSVIAIGFVSAAPARPVPCPDVILPGGACPADVGAAVAQCCPCEGNRNHGSYVSCVAHATNALRAAGCLDKEARTSLKRCAARSTCGKPEGSVTCCKSVPTDCEGGLCEDGVTVCLVAEDCPAKTRCSIKRDAPTCEAQGGVAGTGSCCNACAATP